eukprot:COSAG04_NODE_17414_length_470_cov_0.652291_1_plen_46_part_10
MAESGANLSRLTSALQRNEELTEELGRPRGRGGSVSSTAQGGIAER